jgi:hypothetical protein
MFLCSRLTALLVAHLFCAASAGLLSAQQVPTPQSLPTPLMGWNPFNAFGQNYDEAIVYGQADQLVKLKLAALGYRFVNIDDSWWLRRLPNTIQVNTKLYPDAQLSNGETSMRPFVEHIHAMGLKAGIYTDIGKNSCGQRWERQNTQNLPVGTLQEREIGSFGHQKQDAHLFFAEWGFDLVKVDACGVADYGQGADVVKSGMFAAFDPLSVRGRPAASNIAELQNLYGGFWSAALEAKRDGQPIVSICAWGEADVNDWAHRYGQMWRTSGDVKANWRSVLRNFDSAAPRSLFAGPGRWNDPDMLEVGNGEFDENHLVEARAHMSMWAIIAAPLILGNDLRSIAPSILQVIGNPDVIAVDQDPAGNQGVILSQTADGEVVAKQLATRGHKAIALINRTDKPLTLSVGLNDLHLSPRADTAVRDLWRGTRSLLKGTTITANLSPRETALLRIEGKPSEASVSYPAEMPARIRVAEDGFKPENRTVSRQWIPARIGYLPDGQPLLAGSNQDNDGLGVAAGSRLKIDLNAEFRTISLSPQSLSGKSERYSIFADGRLLRDGQADANLKPVTLKVKGVQQLELVAPKPTETNRQFAWHQVRLTR